jgi:hypothetical protein
MDQVSKVYCVSQFLGAKKIAVFHTLDVSSMFKPTFQMSGRGVSTANQLPRTTIRLHFSEANTKITNLRSLVGTGSGSPPASWRGNSQIRGNQG